ncbi:colicin immunity domain-containing protein [Halopiger goleimassiliensis]|uniref:colicin immunity domain-containing protein n=1 Tax=Halopiger goleimassiliensis TaxID=1293048 RepID=UPI000677EC98|nr:colicin immunity domain-containing protein [Halopiger goleimassiliensis]
MTERDVIEKYESLIESFLEGELSATEFSETYLEEFKNEEPGLSEATFEILQALFREADAYCEDPTLRDSWDIGDEELRDAAAEAAAQLEDAT